MSPQVSPRRARPDRIHRPRRTAHLSSFVRLLMILVVGCSAVLIEQHVGQSTAVHAAGPVLLKTDVSPDAPYGATETPYGDFGTDQAGKMVSVVVDPTNDAVLYGAAEFAGVWKSTDRAHTWRWSSNGLKSGISIGANSLAVDDSNSQRVIYATRDDDLRTIKRFGGLWVSRDAAATWTHATVQGCTSPDLRNVLFDGGRAFITTSCGIRMSTDLSTWTAVTSPPGVTAPDRVAVRGSTIVACNKTSIWRSTSISAPSWVEGPKLPSTCLDLAIAPDSSTTALAGYAGNDGTKDIVGVAAVSFSPNSIVDYRMPEEAESGEQVFAAARRPGSVAGQGPGASYDLIAGNGLRFYLYIKGAAEPWTRIANVHVDTWGVAFPRTYDPAHGNCSAYLASDGGIHTTRATGAASCTLAGASWVQAQSGLHVFTSHTMGGISQPPCGSPLHACPALYLPSKDNSTWSTTQGGVPGSSWKAMVCCGDSGNALIDPELPGQMFTGRGGTYYIYRSSSGTPPTVADKRTEITPPNEWSGVAPPEISTVAQVMTLANENASAYPNGDYFAVESPVRNEGTGDDVIVRNVLAGTIASAWSDISTAHHFGPGAIAAIGVSGGHARPTIYVLIANDRNLSNAGQIYKGQIDASGQVPSWTSMSTGLTRAHNLVVDPYDPNYLYVTDLGAGDIRASSDGGRTWHAEPVLTDIATRHGEFVFDCGDPAKPGGKTGPWRRQCPLAHVAFNRGDPTIRVAVLWPGGVAFSRDAGSTWIPLQGATELLDRPRSAFYDPAINPQTNTPSLYVALHGHGLVRLDAPFATLVGLNFELRGLGPDRTVFAIDDTTGLATELFAGADGVYRGTELFDSRVVTPARHTYRYRIINAGVETPSYSHTLSSGEIAVGSSTTSDTLVARTLIVGNSAVAYPGQAQHWVSRFTDTFGGNAISVARLRLTTQDTRVFVGELVYNRISGQVCLSGPGSLSTCQQAANGTTISNGYLTVDVPGTTISVAGNDLVVTWSFTPADQMASHLYDAVASAVDSAAGLVWQSLTGTSGVTHRPQANAVMPSGGFVLPNTTTPISATVSDPDGALEPNTVALSFTATGVTGPTVAYVRSSNRLFVSNQTPSTPTPGCTPGAAVTLQSSNGITLDCSTSLRIIAGTTMSVTWQISFGSQLSGRRYTESLQATDTRNGDSGARVVGSLAVDRPPQFSSFTPASGSQNPEVAQAFAATFTDGDFAPNLARGKLQFSLKTLFGEKSVELYYSESLNTLTIANGDPKLLPAGCSPGASTIISTTLATLSCKASSVTDVKNAFGLLIGKRVSWSMIPSGSMSGSSWKTRLLVSDDAGVTTGPTDVGSWTINRPPSGAANQPSSGTMAVASVQHFETTAADPDGWPNIHTVDLRIAEGLAGGDVQALWVRFDQDRDTVSLYDPDTGVWIEGEMGSHILMESRYAELRMAGTSMQGTGQNDPGMAITWELVFKLPAAGHTYRQYVQIVDDMGATTGWQEVGVLGMTGTGRLFMPFVIAASGP